MIFAEGWQYKWAERLIYWFVILALLALLIRQVRSQWPYAILADGRALVWLSNHKAAEWALSLALEEASKKHGKREVGFRERIEIFRQKPPAGEAICDPVNAKEKLLRYLTVHYFSFAILVAGKPLLALADRSNAQAVLDAVKAHYAEGIPDLVKEPTFKEKVQIRRLLVQPSLFVDNPDAAVEKILYGIERPRYHLVQAGDLAIAIARRYRLSLKQLETLNAGRDLNRIRIGEKLKVSVGKPLLTVITVRQQIKREPIEYKVERRFEPHLTGGAIVVEQKGRKGVKEVTIHIVCENGIAVRQRVVSERVVRPPVTEILRIGGGLR